MNRWKLLPAVLFLIPLTASVSWGRKSREASTPDEAIKFLVEAARAGDVNAVFDQMIDPMRLLLSVFLEEDRLRREFEASLDEQFGKDPKTKSRPTMKEQLQSLKSMEIIEKMARGKSAMILTVKVTAVSNGKEDTNTEKYVAVQEGKVWKLALVGPPKDPQEDVAKQITEEAEKNKTKLAKRKGSLMKVIQDVKAGKFKNRNEAQDAYIQAILPPPDRKPEPPPQTEDTP